MKIAYFADCKSCHTIRWINYFKKRGHDVFAITSELNDEMGIKQYKLVGGIPMPLAGKDSAFRYVFSPFTILSVRSILAKEMPDNLLMLQ